LFLFSILTFGRASDKNYKAITELTFCRFLTRFDSLIVANNK